MNYNSIDFKLGVMCGILMEKAKDNCCDLENYIKDINEFKPEDIKLTIEMLREICEYFCSDTEIITYQGKKVVVVGEDSIMGIVYIDENGKVDELDSDEFKMRCKECDETKEDIEDKLCYKCFGWITCVTCEFRFNEPESRECDNCHHLL